MNWELKKKILCLMSLADLLHNRELRIGKRVFKMRGFVINKRRTEFFLLILLLSVVISSCSNSEIRKKLVVINGLTMGTTYTVKFVEDSGSTRDNNGDNSTRIKAGIEKVLLQVNSKMSVFMNDSEISRFNRVESTDWFQISPNTAWVIKQALSVSEKSGGAFDITVGPLVNLWGFGTRKVNGIPTEDEINHTLKIVGYKNMSVRLSPPAVKKKIKKMNCDLSAIAKGFGVDKLAEYLESAKITSYLIEIGGEVRTRGKNNHDQWWRIGIASPTGTFGIQKVIELKNQSMATSGDYRNYFEKDGVRYSHTIDPKTGRPISHNLASVTVIKDCCMVADALATAINVLGPEKGYDLAIKENLAVFFILKSDEGFTEKTTPEFERILKSRKGLN
jgi:thiamine biosynthesis lipoprotein